MLWCHKRNTFYLLPDRLSFFRWCIRGLHAWTLTNNAKFENYLGREAKSKVFRYFIRYMLCELAYRLQFFFNIAFQPASTRGIGFFQSKLSELLLRSLCWYIIWSKSTWRTSERRQMALLFIIRRHMACIASLIPTQVALRPAYAPCYWYCSNDEVRSYPLDLLRCANRSVGRPVHSFIYMYTARGIYQLHAIRACRCL